MNTTYAELCATMRVVKGIGRPALQLPVIDIALFSPEMAEQSARAMFNMVGGIVEVQVTPATGGCDRKTDTLKRGHTVACRLIAEEGGWVLISLFISEDPAIVGQYDWAPPVSLGTPTEDWGDSRHGGHFD